jgi:hypothetical protein
MGGDRIPEIMRVTAGEKRRDRYIPLNALPDYEFVAPAQPSLRQLQPAEFIALDAVDAGDVKNQFRLMVIKDYRKVMFQQFEVFCIAGPVGEPDVEAALLLDRIIIFLMHAEREDCGLVVEDEGGAVSLVDVEVNDGGAFEQAVRHCAPEPDRYVIDIAEAFGMVREGVVESACEVHGEAIGDCAAACED